MYDGQLELFPILEPPGSQTRRLKPVEYRVLDKIAQLSAETGWTRALDDLTAHYLRLSVRTLQRHRSFLRNCGLIETEYYANKRLRARVTPAGRDILLRDRFVLDPPARRGRSFAPAVVSGVPAAEPVFAQAASTAPAALVASVAAAGQGGAGAPRLATFVASDASIVVSDPPDVASDPSFGGSLVLDCVQDSVQDYVQDCVPERAPARERRRLTDQTRQLSERNRRRRKPGRSPRRVFVPELDAVFAFAPSAPPAPPGPAVPSPDPAPDRPPAQVPTPAPARVLPPPRESPEPLRPQPAPTRGSAVPAVWSAALERMQASIPPIFVTHLIARLECRETPDGLQLIAPDADLFGRIRRLYWDEILRALAQPAELVCVEEGSDSGESGARTLRIECAEWREALRRLRVRITWPFFEDVFGRVEFQRLSPTEVRLIAPDLHRANRIRHGYLEEVRAALGGNVMIHVEARAA